MKNEIQESSSDFDASRLEPVYDDSSELQQLQKTFEKIGTLKTDTNTHEDTTDFEDIEEIGTEQESELNAVEDETEIDEEVEENELEVPLKKEKKGDKYRKLQNDKYRAIAEKEALAAENERLKTMLNDSISSSTYHYGKNVYNDLERARTKKRIAWEQNNMDEALKADEELIVALNEVRKLEALANQPTPTKGREEAKAHEKVRNEVEVQSEVYKEIANDWLDNHPYLQTTSRYFDPNLANNVWGFIEKLDKQLIATGKENLYYTDQYFDRIDSHISSLVKKPQDVKKNIEALSGASAVKRGVSSDVKKTPKLPPITKDQRVIAYNAGITEEDIRREQLKLMRNK